MMQLARCVMPCLTCICAHKRACCRAARQRRDTASGVPIWVVPERVLHFLGRRGEASAPSAFMRCALGKLPSPSEQQLRRELSESDNGRTREPIKPRLAVRVHDSHAA